MKTNTVEQQFRTLLLWLAGGVCIFTVAELWLTNHMQNTIQLIPFVLCGVGLVAVGGALFRPGHVTLWALRIVMALMMAGSVLGIAEHLQGNWEFALEIRPNAPTSQVLLSALKGANPLLAPGILALGALLALAATYQHPALAKRRRAPTANNVQPGVTLGERWVK